MQLDVWRLTWCSEPPDPLMTEAASSIIFAAPHVESKGNL